MIWSSPDRIPVRGGAIGHQAPDAWDLEELGGAQGLLASPVEQADLDALP